MGHDSGLPYEQEVERSERGYKGSRKPNSIDSDAWRSMNSYAREGHVEAELTEAEAKAMSKHDSRDAAAAAKIDFDDGCESPVVPNDNDRWVLDAKLGILTRIHVKSRRAKFDPTSIKDCPASADEIMDARVTVVETEGAEFVVHDLWRKPSRNAMPFRWSGKTVFVLRQSLGVEVKVRPVEAGILPPSEIPDRAYGYGLEAKSSLMVAPGCSALVNTGMSCKKPDGVWALGKLRKELGVSTALMSVQVLLRMMIREVPSKSAYPIRQAPTLPSLKVALLRLPHSIPRSFVRLHSPLRKMSIIWTATPLRCLLLRLRVLCVPIFLRCLYEVLRIFTAAMTKLYSVTVLVLRAPLMAKSALLIPRLRRPLTKSGIGSSLKGVGTIAACASGPIYRLKLAELGLLLTLVASLTFVLRSCCGSQAFS